MRLPKINDYQAAGLCAIFFVLVAVYGGIADGMGWDDWWLYDGPPDNPFITSEGRWGQHFLFRQVFGDHLMVSLKFFLAFFCLFGVSRLLSLNVSDEDDVPLSSVLIFVVGVYHIYMSDVFSFSGLVFEIPFAMFLSASGFHILKAAALSGEQNNYFLPVLLAGQLLAFSISIYQPVAVFGFIIPILAFATTARLFDKTFIKFVLVCAAAGTLSLILYLVEFEIYQYVIGVELEALRTAPITKDVIAAKASIDHVVWVLNRIHSGMLLDIPVGLKMFNQLFALVVVLVAIAVSAGSCFRVSGTAEFGPQLVRSGRFLFGAMVGMFLVPLVILPVSPYLVPRAFSYLGFYHAAVLLLCLRMLGEGRGWSNVISVDAARRVVFSILAVVGTVYLFVSAAAVEDRKRINERDMELARMIFARVSSVPGYVAGPFYIVGGVDYQPELIWGSSIGRSIFTPWREKHPKFRLGIFREIYDLPWKPEIIKESPKSCPGFPAEQSVFLHDNHVYVCLSDQTVN